MKLEIEHPEHMSAHGLHMLNVIAVESKSLDEVAKFLQQCFGHRSVYKGGNHVAFHALVAVGATDMGDRTAVFTEG